MEPSLPDNLGLPEYPHMVLASSPIVLTICQVRFTPVLSIADATFVAPFQRAIQQKYPVTIKGENVELQFGFGAAAAELQQGGRSPHWQFSDQQDNWKVTLSEGSISLETRTYEEFSDFVSRLREVLAPLIEHVNPSVVTRIGLRYINEIRLGNLELIDAINPQLLGALAVSTIADRASSAVQEILLEYPQNQRIRIRHGRFPHGTTVQPRAGETAGADSFYLLDFDGSSEFPLPAGLSIDTNVICRHVETYNKAIYRLFRWSVTDKYIQSTKG